MEYSKEQITQALTDFLRKKIAQRKNGISFTEYMQWALYHPQWGYYQNDTPKFGRYGDFITAPEISPLFGQCLAHHMACVLKKFNYPIILEFGAGSGQLLYQLLSTLEVLGQLPIYYYVVEISSALQKRQHQLILEKLPHLLDRVIWLTKLPAALSLTGVILANEVLDAMPIHRFCFHANQFWEYYVTIEQGLFTEQPIPANARLNTALRNIVKQNGPFAAGYRSEINLLLSPWLKQVANCLTAGEILFIDYGFSQSAYYHPDRDKGALTCYYQHRMYTDPYCFPGLQDITASVDFTAVAKRALKTGLTVAGYTTQAHFLLENELLNLVDKARLLHPNKDWSINQILKQLILPSAMGEAFKVMGLTKKITEPLPGFSQVLRY